MGSQMKKEKATSTKGPKGKGIGVYVMAHIQKHGTKFSSAEFAEKVREKFDSNTTPQSIAWYKAKATKLGLANNPSKLKNASNPNPSAKKPNTSRKGALIKGMTNKLPSEILANSVFKSKLDEIMKGYSGIYALYNDARLYYVGLTNNLRGRINQHLKDRHARKWTEFVIFRIKHVKYLKDIETLLLNIHNTPGNRHKGKVPLDADINRLLLDILKQHEKQMKSIKKALK
jgi:hypothetical protein